MPAIPPETTRMTVLATSSGADHHNIPAVHSTAKPIDESARVVRGRIVMTPLQWWAIGLALIGPSSPPYTSLEQWFRFTGLLHATALQAGRAPPVPPATARSPAWPKTWLPPVRSRRGIGPAKSVQHGVDDVSVR